MNDLKRCQKVFKRFKLKSKLLILSFQQETRIQAISKMYFFCGFLNFFFKEKMGAICFCLIKLSKDKSIFAVPLPVI